MPGFNHYARLKRILDTEPAGWYIVRIDEPTQATNFRGETTYFDHYYRLYHADGGAVRFGKFQQIDRLAHALHCEASDLPVVTSQ
jgi:hypothetical protein